MEEHLERPTEFRRIGGFAPFPFFPAVFDLGEFRIAWKNWVFFERFEVRFCGSLFMKTGPKGSIISMERVEGHFQEPRSKGSEGLRLSATFGEDEFYTDCRVEKLDTRGERLHFTVYGNKTEIGSFSWIRGSEEVITGVIQKGRFSEAWFLGMCLMKLWRVERDRSAGA
jgi:hypothetical protein